MNIEIGVCVLMKFSGKKNAKYFVPEIIFISDIYGVKYLKRDLTSQKFAKEDPTTNEVDKKDVVLKLPHPILSGGSERQLRS